jgi:phage terminase small subunit
MVVALSLPEDQQQQALEDAMQPRQLAFCKEYVIDFDRGAAAIRAGYAPSNAHTTSYNLMLYRGVRKLIEIYTRSNAQKVTTVDPEWVINKITEIVTTSSKDGDKLRGLELLARHLGMFIERTEISGRDGEAIKIEETKNQADEVARKLRAMGSKVTPLSVVK